MRTMTSSSPVTPNSCASTVHNSNDTNMMIRYTDPERGFGAFAIRSCAQREAFYGHGTECTSQMTGEGDDDAPASAEAEIKEIKYPMIMMATEPPVVAAPLAVSVRAAGIRQSCAWCLQNIMSLADESARLSSLVGDSSPPSSSSRNAVRFTQHALTTCRPVIEDIKEETADTNEEPHESPAEVFLSVSDVAAPNAVTARKAVLRRMQSCITWPLTRDWQWSFCNALCERQFTRHYGAVRAVLRGPSMARRLLDANRGGDTTTVTTLTGCKHTSMCSSSPKDLPVAEKEAALAALVDAMVTGNEPQTSPTPSGLAALSPRACLSVIHRLCTIYNERFTLVLLLLCKLLAEKLEDRRLDDGPPEVPCHFLLEDALRLRDRIVHFVARYDEGPFRTLTDRQRRTARLFSDAFNSLLQQRLQEQQEQFNDLTGITTSEPAAASAPPLASFVTPQDIQSLVMVLDTNAHSCVILSPWYLLAQTATTTTANSTGTNTASTDEEGRRKISRSDSISSEKADENNEIRWFERLLYQHLSPNHVNVLGVALYDRCTKINHSCRPNVRFMPTFAPVRAVVVARGPIAAGEELRTSYVDIDDEFSESACPQHSTSDVNRIKIVERREKLRKDYGFDCDCPRCQEGL